jgi:hypothetical protein
VRRVQLFLIILAASLGLLLALVAASLYLAATAPALYRSSWMGQMWGGGGGMGDGGMMGGGGYALSYLWIIPAALIGIAVVGVIGTVYFVAFPEIIPVPHARETTRMESVPADPPKEPVPPAPSLSEPQNPYESVSKTLTPEERKVLNILTAHQGKYLQKYIRKEAGLSRLKTHRIIARFAERGIVTLRRSGNTNEIFLSDWLKDSKPQNPA